MVRSVIAVLAGYLVFGVSAVVLFKASGRDPHVPAGLGFMLLSSLYGIFFAAVGGFLAAWLARRYEFEHALAVAGLIAVAGAASLLTRPGQGAMWTELAALLIMAPAAMAGGWARQRQVGAGHK